MAQKFTQVPIDTFEKLQLNAGILVDDFNPSTGVIGSILGATTGGITFASNPSFKDFGEDIDNVPNNMMELKHVEQYDPTMSGTFLTCSQETIKSLVGAADTEGDIKVVPRADLETSDFDELWWVGDYSNVNQDGTSTTAGFLAIHLMNALNTTGFQIKSTKNEKGQMAFEYHGHYSINDQDTVPFEIYVKAGTALARLTVISEAGATSGKSKITVSGYTLGSGESFVYQTAVSAAPSVEYGDSVSNWTVLTSGSEITPTASHTKITVAVKDSDGKAIGAGSTTLVVAS